MKAYLVKYSGGRLTETVRNPIEGYNHVEFVQADGKRIEASFDGSTVRLRTPDGILTVLPEASNALSVQGLDWDALIVEMQRGEKLLGKKNKGVGSKRRLSSHSKKD